MIHVVIIEDIKEIREGLQMLIDSSDGFACPRTFANAEQAIDELPSVCPDVALMDIHLPGINGIEAVRKLKNLCPGTQFIMSTIYEDDENIFEESESRSKRVLTKENSSFKNTRCH